MQVGVQLPEVERVVPWSEYREMAIAAEEAGFASIWLGDHLLYDKPDGPRGPWECWSLLGALAAVTHRVLLGPLVSPTGFRNPALLAKMAATIDEIAGGRLVLGLGSGWNRHEFDAFGYPFDQRVSRFSEAFQIIVSLVRDGRADLDGRFHKVRAATLAPPARVDLPLMIGSSGPRMLELTAPHMDWWNEWWSAFGNDPAGLRPLIDRVDGALERVGRDPGSVVKSAAVLVQMPGGGGRVMGADHGAAPIAGSISEITDRLAAFGPLVGHLQLVVDPITTASIEALSPVVAALDG